MQSDRAIFPIFTPAHAALWMIGSVLVMALIVALFVGLFTDGGMEVFDDQVTLGALSALGFLLVTGRLLSRYPGGPTLREAVGARGVNPLLVVLGLGIGFTAQAPADALRAWTSKMLSKAGEPDLVGVTLEATSRVQAFALVIVLVGLVPFAEEAFFRGAVYGAMRRSRASVWLAGLTTALGFVMSHGSLLLFGPILIVATVLAILRGTSGSLYPSLAAHVGFNAVPVLGVTAPGIFLDRFMDRYELALAGGLVVLLTAFVGLARTSALSRRNLLEEARPVALPPPEEAS